MRAAVAPQGDSDTGSKPMIISPLFDVREHPLRFVLPEVLKICEGQAPEICSKVSGLKILGLKGLILMLICSGVVIPIESSGEKRLEHRPPAYDPTLVGWSNKFMDVVMDVFDPHKDLVEPDSTYEPLSPWTLAAVPESRELRGVKSMDARRRTEATKARLYFSRILPGSSDKTISFQDYEIQGFLEAQHMTSFPVSVMTFENELGDKCLSKTFYPYQVHATVPSAIPACALRMQESPAEASFGVNVKPAIDHD